MRRLDRRTLFSAQSLQHRKDFEGSLSLEFVRARCDRARSGHTSDARLSSGSIGALDQPELFQARHDSRGRRSAERLVGRDRADAHRPELFDRREGRDLGGRESRATATTQRAHDASERETQSRGARDVVRVVSRLIERPLLRRRSRRARHPNWSRAPLRARRARAVLVQRSASRAGPRRVAPKTAMAIATREDDVEAVVEGSLEQVGEEASCQSTSTTGRSSRGSRSARRAGSSLG